MTFSPLPPLDIYADLVLSFNGEDLKVHIEGNRMVVSAPSFRSGIRILLKMLDIPDWVRGLDELDKKLTNLFLTLFMQAGKVRFALLGLEGKSYRVSLLKWLARRRGKYSYRQVSYCFQFLIPPNISGNITIASHKSPEVL
jgi:hypothetical protein